MTLYYLSGLELRMAVKMFTRNAESQSKTALPPEKPTDPNHQETDIVAKRPQYGRKTGCYLLMALTTCCPEPRVK